MDKDTINSFRNKYPKGLLCDIYFHSNRTPFLLQHNALNWIEKHQLFDCLINNPIYDGKIVNLPQTQSINIDEQKLNEEQNSAILNIVNGKDDPWPYLLFGPPGRVFFYIFAQINCNYK